MQGRLEVRGRETVGPPMKPRRDRGEAERGGSCGGDKMGWEVGDLVWQVSDFHLVGCRSWRVP